MMDRDSITRTGAKDPWGRGANASRAAAHGRAGGPGLRTRRSAVTEVCEGGGKLSGREGMPGAGLTETPFRKALSDMLALKPYWGKPAVRDLGGRWKRRHHSKPGPRHRPTRPSCHVSRAAVGSSVSASMLPGPTVESAEAKLYRLIEKLEFSR